MKRLACSLLLLFSFTQSPADSLLVDPYKVLPEEGEFADQSIMLLKHLARQPQERVWQREVELARIQNENHWKVYKEKLLGNYKKSLGLPFPERTPLNAEIIKVIDRETYRIENILYQSMPDIYVTANLYLPHKGEGPYPGILFPCGHSSNGKAYKLYHEAALGLVQKGYVVLVYDPPGQGERYQYLKDDGTPLIGKPTSEHTLLANPLFLMGKHLMALFLWDGIRGIDYLQSRKEVDPERIGCTGNSGGGTVTLHLVPLEPRIKVAVAVGTVNSPYMELGTGYASDGEQNLPLQVPYGLAHADLMMLAYPRPYRLIKESKDRVRIGTRDSFVQAKFLYQTLGQGEKMTYVETEWPHGYFKAMREPMYYWFGKWLYGREDDHLEPELRVEEEKELLCSQTGQILNERGIAVWQWAAKELEKNFPEPPVPASETEHRSIRDSLLCEARALLNIPVNKITPQAVDLGRVEEAVGVVEKIALYSEEDIYLPCLYFKPQQKKSPTVILLDSHGKTRGGTELTEQLVSKGYGVFAVDLRGMGETALTEADSLEREGTVAARILGDEAGGAYDGLRLGRSIFAMRVHDLLQVVEYLATREEVDAGKIAVIGKKSCGPLALYAAALDERIKGVIVDSSLALFADLVTSRDYTWHFMDFLPQVLRFHDLPQVAGSLAPRIVWMLNLLDSCKRLKEKEDVVESYTWSVKCYRALNRPDNFQISDYATPSQRKKLYIDWAKTVF